MTLHDWLNDIPQQFLNKRNIEILLKAFSRQIDELKQVFEDLKNLTTLQNATGQSLRYIGDIMSTSLKEAQTILMSANNDVITDEVYRKVLMYKALQNNCDCTYSDIMESIRLLWDTSNLKYIEKPEVPATIFISLPEVDVDGMDPALGRVLAIKPAGVAMIYTVGYAAGVNISGIEKVKLANVLFALSNPMIIDEDIAMDMTIKSKTEVVETVTASVTYYRNFWIINGDYLLDGTKLLDAEKVEEVL